MMFLSFRALHVVLAGTWYGAVAFITLFLGPAVADVGPAGTPLMASLMKRKLHAFMASVGGLTVVTGLYLFWHLTSGNPDIAGTRGGISFSIGALTGFIALILGGSMIGRTVKKMGALAVRLAAMPEGAERSAAITQMSALRQRSSTFEKIVLVLLTISMITMALGHYI
jgi:uncharacterized membrane protein